MSELQRQAARLGPNQSIRLATDITTAQVSPEGSDVLQWGISAIYDSLRKEVGFIGKRDGPNPFHWVVYDEAQNHWRLDPRPLWSTASVFGHGYDHNTFDPATGTVYHVPYGGKVVQTWNGNGWQPLPAWTQNTTATGGLTFFPGLGLVYNDGFGVLLFDGTSWTTLGTGNGSSYHDFSEYNSSANVLIFGGGNSSSYYKLTSARVISPIAAPPFTIGAAPATQGSACTDPLAARIIARSQPTGAWASYDINSNTWSSLTVSTGDGSTPQTGTPPLAINSNSAVCASIPAYGVTMWLQVRASSQTVDCWLYRAP